MQTVSRFESNLLRLLYYFLGREPAERGLALVEARLQPPTCLSRAAVRLAQDALATGCVHLLATRGGWRRERFLRAGKPAEGRLWQRTPPAELALTFSRHALAFLIWITAARPLDKRPHWGPAQTELMPGDLLLLYLAHQGLREGADSLGAPQLRLRTPFVEHALCRLAYPEDFTAAPVSAAPSFAPWTKGVGAAILEALQPELEARWMQIEGGKGSIALPEQMQALGCSQQRVLSAFLDALESESRPDLARFLLAAAARLLGPHANVEMWTGSLRTAGQRLADRSSTYQAALAFVQQMERLRAWDRQARSVGYFEEGYAASQLWKADWDHYQGDVLCERARAIIRELDPMRNHPA
jgi:FtsH ternary system-associated peptide